jgi:hypothetical protein
MKLLAGSFTAQELNDKAWSLYAEFRPAVDQWGKRSEMKCSTILALRGKDANIPGEFSDKQEIIKFENQDITPTTERETDMPPVPKRTKSSSLEEYEAALDNNFSYDNIPV